jgi:hypothetical protein
LHSQQYAFIHYKGFRTTIHKLDNISRAIRKGIRAKTKNIFAVLLRCGVIALVLRLLSIFSNWHNGLETADIGHGVSVHFARLDQKSLRFAA